MTEIFIVLRIESVLRIGQATVVMDSAWTDEGHARRRCSVMNAAALSMPGTCIYQWHRVSIELNG